MRTRMSGRGDLPRGRAARQMGAVREDQLRLRRGAGGREQARRRVRDRAQRPEPAARIVSARAGNTSVPRRGKGTEMPQEAWSNKRERQYEHIKDSAKDRGASTKRAKEIAAR